MTVDFSQLSVIAPATVAQNSRRVRLRLSRTTELNYLLSKTAPFSFSLFFSLSPCSLRAIWIFLTVRFLPMPLSSDPLHPRTGIDVDVSATLGIRFRPIDAFLCSMIPLEQLPDRYPDSTLGCTGSSRSRLGRRKRRRVRDTFRFDYMCKDLWIFWKSNARKILR